MGQERRGEERRPHGEITHLSPLPAPALSAPPTVIMRTRAELEASSRATENIGDGVSESARWKTWAEGLGSESTCYCHSGKTLCQRLPASL